jgi:hypothetical protein
VDPESGAEVGDELGVERSWIGVGGTMVMVRKVVLSVLLVWE